MPINNYIVATEPLGDAAPLAEDIAANDTRFVVNYWRQTPDKRLLFGGGESYGYRFPDDIAAQSAPCIGSGLPAACRSSDRSRLGWHSGDHQPPAGRILRGPHPPYLARRGYSGHGVALSVMAGRVLAEAIRGTTTRFDLLAGLPTMRFPGGAAARAPLLALAMRWYSLRDRLGI